MRRRSFRVKSGPGAECYSEVADVLRLGYWSGTLGSVTATSVRSSEREGPIHAFRISWSLA